MFESEHHNTKQVYHIGVVYIGPQYVKRHKKRIFRSGHFLMAKSPEEALILANIHKIGNPMGSDTNVKHRSLSGPHPIRLKYAQSRKGSVWHETDGELKPYGGSN